MGYHRPVSHFNIGKKAEHYSRKHFAECVAANSAFCARYELTLPEAMTHTYVDQRRAAVLAA